MTREEAANIIKSECYACNLFNLDWTTIDHFLEKRKTNARNVLMNTAILLDG